MDYEKEDGLEMDVSRVRDSLDFIITGCLLLKPTPAIPALPSFFRFKWAFISLAI